MIQFSCVCQLLSHVWFFETPWTVALQAPLFMGFSRQEYWSELPFPSPEHLPNPGIKHGYPVLQTDSLLTELSGKLSILLMLSQIQLSILSIPCFRDCGAETKHFCFALSKLLNERICEYNKSVAVKFGRLCSAAVLWGAFFFLGGWIFVCKQMCWENRLWLCFSVQFSCSVMCNSLWPHGLQHPRPSCPSPTPRAYSNSCPSSRWCYPPIASSVIPFSSCPCSFPESGSFPMNQFFTHGQSIVVSASASVLPVNFQDWFPLGWTGWISLQSKGLSRVFSFITVKKHQFFGVQLSF